MQLKAWHLFVAVLFSATLSAGLASLSVAYILIKVNAVPQISTETFLVAGDFAVPVPSSWKGAESGGRLVSERNDQTWIEFKESGPLSSSTNLPLIDESRPLLVEPGEMGVELYYHVLPGASGLEIEGYLLKEKRLVQFHGNYSPERALLGSPQQAARELYWILRNVRELV